MGLPIKNKINYRPEIDGLRALAVNAVIIYHFNKYFLSSGFLGVDIFFVISGYVITSSLLNKTYRSLKEIVREFYFKRIKRIFPALTFYVVITSLLICFFDPEPLINLRTGIASIFGISNLYLFRYSTDYFAQATEFNVFTHTWSLGVEEQYYFLFPFLFWFTGISLNFSKGRKKFLIIFGTLSIISLLFFLYSYQTNHSAAYFLMPFRFWEIGMGSISFLFRKKIYNFFNKGYKNYFVMFLFILIISCFFLPVSKGIFAIPIMVLLTSLLISIIDKKSFIFKLLTNKVALHIGKLSYSLYLWHWGILALSRWTIGVSFWTIPIQLFLIYILSIISYTFIENPIRYKKNNFKYNVLGLGSIFISIFGLFSLLQKFSSILYLGNKSIDNQLSRNLINNKSNINCDFGTSNIFNERKIENCIFLNEKTQNNDNNIFFVGSSHSGTLSGMIEKISNEIDGKKINLFVGGSFFPSLPKEHYLKADKNSIYKPDIFNANQSSIENYIYQNASIGDTIVIANHLQLLFAMDKNDSDEKLNIKNKYLNEYFSNLEKFTQIVSKKNINIIYLEPYPFFNGFNQNITNTKYCSKQWFKKFNRFEGCEVSLVRSELIESLTNINIGLDSLSEKNKNFYIFRTFNLLCPNNNRDECTNKVDDKIYLYDADHLNNYGGRYIAPYFKILFNSI